jgi:DNA-binding XRE family transcriptional regulator
VGFDVIAAVRDHYEKIGFRLLPLRDGRSWSLVFPFDVAPFPLPGAEAHGLFHRIPGSVLRAARASLLASQEEVAAKSGLAHTTIRMLERSNPSISATRALKYQNFFNDTEVQITPPDGEVGWRLELRTEKQASVSR